MSSISRHEAIDQFRAAMLAAGLEPPDTIKDSGRLERFSTNGKRKDDSGWYIFHSDGLPAGAFGDWRTGFSTMWAADVGRRLTPEEVERNRARMAEARRQAEAERQSKADRARRQATALISAATEAAGDHPYLARKQITRRGNLFELPIEGVKKILGYHPAARGEPLTGRVLLAPITIGSKLSSVEMIDEHGRKSAIAGGIKKGGAWTPEPIPADAASIVIGEGVATVSSVRQATGLPVVAALSSGNLESVARQFRQSHPDAAIVILADTAKATGGPDSHAVEAARAVGGVLAVPNITPDAGSDFNDQHVSQGIESVARTIRAALANSDSEPVTTENDVTSVTPVTPTAGAASGCNGTEKPDATNVTSADQPEPEPEAEPGPPDPEAPESPIPALSARPRFIVLDDWHTVGERRYRPGTWYFGAKQQKDGSLEPVEQWLCSPIHIEAVTRDSQANNIGRLLRFKTTLKRWRTWAMPCELLAGDGVDLRRELLAMGVELDPLSRNLFAQYLNTPPPKRRIHCALAVGWTADGSFVLPDQVIGPQAANVIYQSAERADGEYTMAGSLDGWRASIAAHAIGNPLLALALSAAFAGPLLSRCNAESGGIHFVGDSSTGKTTAIEAACSVWGGGGFKKSWRATANGLEAVAALHSDNLLPLDEISEADGRDIGAVIYMIGNGRGKSRATRTGRARAVTRWRTFLLSTGERGIEASMSEAGHRTKQGQSVRLADVPAARPFGVFDHLSGFPTGAALADHLKTASITHHGHAGRAFLERLTRESRNLSEFLERFKALPEFSPDGAQGQIRRVAGRFALLALAGELATEYGVTGWPEGEAIRAAAVGFELWRNTRDTGNGETRQIIEAVSRFLDRHADSRFSSIKESADGSHEAMRYDRAGYYTDEGPGRAYLFNADGLHAALKGFDFRRALDVLEQAGALAKSPNGERTRSYRTPGGVKRLYPIIAERLEVGHGT